MVVHKWHVSFQIILSFCNGCDSIIPYECIYHKGSTFLTTGLERSPFIERDERDGSVETEACSSFLNRFLCKLLVL